MLSLRGVLLRRRGRDRPVGARLLLLLLPPVRVLFYHRRSVRGVQHAATPARGAGPAAAGPGAVVPRGRHGVGRRRSRARRRDRAGAGARRRPAGRGRALEVRDAIGCPRSPSPGPE